MREFVHYEIRNAPDIVVYIALTAKLLLNNKHRNTIKSAKTGIKRVVSLHK